MTDRELIRHTVATLAYRAAKTMRGAPESFTTYKAAPDANPPLRIVNHMADLFDWALTMVYGEPKWSFMPAPDWHSACARFFASLEKFDSALANTPNIDYDLTKIFQGPIADALTHTGQLAMLRRLAGYPMKGESYIHSDIAIGRVGPDQTPPNPKYEFD